jgi:hypothetical protein
VTDPTRILPTTLVGPYPTLPVAALALDLPWQAADTVNGNSFVASGREILLVANTDEAASHTFTLTSAADDFKRTGDVTNYVLGEAGHVGAQATVLADVAATVPLTVVGGTNDALIFTNEGGAGTPETFTLAPGTYSTLAAVIAALAAATGSVSSERFDTLITPSDGGAGKIRLTMVALGADDNGDTITLGVNDVAAALGFTGNPDTFASGGPDVGFPTIAAFNFAQMYGWVSGGVIRFQSSSASVMFCVLHQP